MPSKLRQPNGTFVSTTSFADEVVQIQSATIPTATGATDVYITSPVTGSLVALQLTPLVALAAHDTNYVAFTATNLGLDGTGTTVMLATAPAGVNTTKITGGTALAVNTQRVLTPHGTAANVAVVKGQRIKITATGNGTLANTVTVPTYAATFRRSV